MITIFTLEAALIATVAVSSAKAVLAAVAMVVVEMVAAVPGSPNKRFSPILAGCPSGKEM